MKRYKVFWGIMLLLTITSFAQTAKKIGDKPFIIIDGKDTITKNAFIRLYKKNNSLGQDNSIDDYLKLYENFCLKVEEAKSLGYDTTKSFKREFSVYKKQLVAPYLIDSAKLEALLKEAYERMKKDVRVSQIMVMLPKNPTPSDTLKAYRKIMKAYKELKNGKDFAEVAKKFSEHKYSANKGGDMGWFNVFRYPYEFETVAYNTPQGKISHPFRTRVAYHIIKKTGERPNKGKVQVAHILVALNLYSTDKEKKAAKAKIDSIYNLLQHGADFAELAKKLSDDRGSAYRGGLLDWFGTGDMVEPFENAAFSLKNIGDISKPVRTPVGYHILKLMNIKPIKSYEEMKPELLVQLKRNDRYNLVKKSFINKLKKEYNFSYNKKALADFYRNITDSIVFGKINKDKLKKLNKTLFTLDGKSYSQQEFADYLLKKYSKRKPKPNSKIKLMPVKYLINRDFNNFVDDFIRNYEITKLPYKYPEYKYILDEYYDGILLFDIMDDMVWKKAVKDTVGLKKYYESNKQKYLYPIRYDATKFTATNKKSLKKLIKILKKQQKLDYTPDEIVDKIGGDNVKIEWSGLYEKNKNKEVDDAVSQAKGKYPYWILKGDSVIVYIAKEVAPSPKPLKEIKGIVVSDYQTYLEQQWLKKLSKKHKLEVKQDVLNEIKKEIK